jgi:hypothetical protein
MTHEVSITIRRAVFLAGCARQQPPESNEPKSQRNYNRDLYECEREVTFVGVGNKQQVFDNCMKARGYTLKVPTDR